MSTNSSLVWFYQKCTVVGRPWRLPPPHTHTHIKFVARLWTLKAWCFVLFSVSWWKLDTAKVSFHLWKKTHLSSSCRCCGRGTNVNTFAFAYMSAVVQEKRAFSPSLNCSAHWEWFVCIQRGFLFQSFYFGNVLVLSFPKRTNGPSLLLSVSLSSLGRPLPSYRSIPLPTRMFFITRYTIARGIPVHFEISFWLSRSFSEFLRNNQLVLAFHFPPSVTELSSAFTGGR